MKKIYLGLLIGLFSTAIHAQSAKLEWAKSMGGGQTDRATSITTDALGNVYTTGRYQDTVDFDPGAAVYNLISKGSWDIFVQKLDSNGNLVWAKSMGGTSTDYGYGITIDANGNIYLTGQYSGTADFDPGVPTFNLTANANYDYFVQKLDSGGNFIWVKSMGGIGEDLGRFITTDVMGNVLITGYFRDTVDFDPGAGTFNLTSNGVTDIFVQKLDSAGNFIWANSMGGASYDFVWSITTDKFSNVYITGEYYSTADFDPSAATFILTSNGGTDIFIQKLDAGGNLIWAKGMGGVSVDIGYSSVIDDSGNVYVAGHFKLTADFDPGAATFNMTSVSAFDVFIVKLDSAGNFVWAKSVAGTFNSFCYSVAIDAAGNIYMAGEYFGIADFNPGVDTFVMTSNGSMDIYIMKLDNAGDFVWAKSTGGKLYDYGLCMTTNALGDIYVSGSYQDTVDFNPNAMNLSFASNGSEDIFIQKFSPCSASSGIDIITACDSFTWINGTTYTANNNTASETLINFQGCDSIVTLDLTINVVDATVTTTSPSITANAAGASYQWLDCNSNYAVINGDTAQSFIATVNGSYAVEVTENGCTDTSACIEILGLGIQENPLFRDVSIFPNPNSGLVNIDLGTLRDVSIKVFTETGQLIYQEEEINTSIYQFELEVAAGVYLIEVSTDGQKQEYKLIKK